MSSPAAKVFEPPVAQSAFHDLTLGKSSQFVVARLLRFCESQSMNSDSEFFGITMLLLDEKDSTINGFIPAARTNHYRPALQEGNILKVANFEVIRSPHMFKTTENTLAIRFTPQTTIAEAMNNAPVINMQRFMVREYEHLQILANTNLELPDVVGQIKSVNECPLMNEEPNTPLIIRFLIAPMKEIYLSLMDGPAAEEFRSLLLKGDRTDYIMVVTTVNPQKIGGEMYLRSTSATRFFGDDDLPMIKEFKRSLPVTVTKDLPYSDAKIRSNDKQVASIGDLYTHLSDSKAKEAKFICKARVVEVLNQNGWSYVCCTNCSKMLHGSGHSLRCTHCADPSPTGVVKYRVELLVEDANDMATFVVYDKDMLQLTNQDAGTLTLDEVNQGEGQELPQCVAELGGREFIFNISATPYNFISNQNTFSVSGISEQTSKESLKAVPSAANEMDSGGESTSGSGSSKEGRKRSRE